MCLTCGTVTSNPKYCSRECSRQAERSRRVTATCPCGTEFKAPASRIAQGNKYCSVACYRKVGPGRRAEFAWVTCPCGVKFETRAWRLANGRGKYCSRKCAGRYVQRKGVKLRKVRPSDPEASLRWRLATFHGMTPDDYRALIAAQGSRCYLCREPLQFDKKTQVCIDHDHRCCPTNYSCSWCRRGLACKRCNMLLGKVSDDPALLHLIAENLETALSLLKLEGKPSKSLSAGWLDFLAPTLRKMDLRAAGK